MFIKNNIESFHPTDTNQTLQFKLNLCSLTAALNPKAVEVLVLIVKLMIKQMSFIIQYINVLPTLMTCSYLYLYVGAGFPLASQLIITFLSSESREKMASSGSWMKTGPNSSLSRERAQNHYSIFTHKTKQLLTVRRDYSSRLHQRE